MRYWEFSRCTFLFPMCSFLVPWSTPQEFWGRSHLKPAHGTTSVSGLRRPNLFFLFFFFFLTLGAFFFFFFFSKPWGPFFPPWYKGQISVFLSFCRENCATHRLVRAKKISSAALWHWGSEGKYVRTLRRASRKSRLSNNEIASSTHYGEIHGICAAA